MSEPSDLTPVDWNDFSELHKADDGGGVLSSLKAVRQGKLAELVHFVASLPEDYEAASKCADEGLTFGEVEGGEPVVQAVHKLRSAVAEWFQLDLTEVEEEHDTSLVKRLRGWMGRG